MNQALDEKPFLELLHLMAVGGGSDIALPIGKVVEQLSVGIG